MRSGNRTTLTGVASTRENDIGKPTKKYDPASTSFRFRHTYIHGDISFGNYLVCLEGNCINGIQTVIDFAGKFRFA